MRRSAESFREAEVYVEVAENAYQKFLERDNAVWNPVVVNCIMAMIKCTDAMMLEHRGHTNRDHSKTANELQKLYEDGLISESFRSNVDSVRNWDCVVKS